jgi:hypothetical protein
MMGGSDYSWDAYDARMAHHKTTGTSAFTHDADVRAGRTTVAVHEKLDPSKPNKAGKLVRESFDSDAHPVSTAVAVFFDVTGSMAEVPKIFITKLGTLMASLVKKGFIEHPHILFGAVGDATTDSAPIQVGQFESGNEMDEALSLFNLEGGGGGQNTESYELSMYYMARHADMHCVTKRGKKAYVFFLGDEVPYPRVKKSEVKAFIGDDIQDDISLEDIVTELREKFEVFWLMPGGTSHFNDDGVIKPLQKLFGQNFRKMENPEDVCEMIATIIGVNEGYDLHDVGAALKDVGASAASVKRVTTELVPYASTRAVTKGATASGELATTTDGGDSVARL